MLGVKMLHQDEGHTRVGLEVIHQLRNSVDAACGSSNGHDRDVIQVLSRGVVLWLREILLVVFTRRFRAHKFPSVCGDEHAALQENERVMTSSHRSNGPMSVIPFSPSQQDKRLRSILVDLYKLLRKFLVYNQYLD